VRPTDARSRELALLSLLSLPGLFALGVAVGWIWLTPPEEPERWAVSPEDELTRPPETIEERELHAFPVRRASTKKISHYRDADGVFHFVEEKAPAAAEAGSAQASNTAELGATLNR
jgi:hypothetical protein